MKLKTSFFLSRFYSSSKFKKDFISKNDKSISKVNEYDSIVQRRSAEAERSTFIVHPSSASKLYDFADKFGKIGNFMVFSRQEKNYALIEYTNSSSLLKLLECARHFPNEHRIPYSFGKCLYFHAPAFNSGRLNHKLSAPSNRPIVSVDERLLNDGELLECANIDAQMRLLHRRFSMSELDVRLKYFLASEIECAVKCIFPKGRVRLFGSSVNHLGRFNGDADMTLCIEEEEKENRSSMHQHPLYYMSRIRPEDSRQFSKQILDVLGGVLAHIAPQFMNVRRILRARVPIVKLVHSPTEIECDICLNNESAIEMSQILYTLVELEPRFSELVFTLRQWARCNHVISPNPGPWLTNFMISMFVLFRLQTIDWPLLPTLVDVRKMIGDCKPLIRSKSENKQTLEELLIDFFTFYSTFDFISNGLSLNLAEVIDKPEGATAIYLGNPLEPELNICKNVDVKHKDIFQQACLKAVVDLNEMSSVKSGILNILSFADPVEDKLKESCEFYAEVEEKKTEEK